MEDKRNRNTAGKIVGILLGIIYVIVWGFAMVVFYGYDWKDEAMAFSILFIWVVMPVMNFVFAFILGRLNSGGWAKWLIPVAMGIMYMLLEYFTFSMSNNVATHSINPPEWTMIAIGGIIALIGMMIGSAMRMKKAHDKAKMVERTATRELPELEQLRNKETPEHVAKMEVVDVVPEVPAAPVEVATPDSDGFVEIPQETIEPEVVEVIEPAESADKAQPVGIAAKIGNWFK